MRPACAVRPVHRRPRRASDPPSRAKRGLAARVAAWGCLLLLAPVLGCPDETDVILVASASGGSVRVTGTGDTATVRVSATVTLELGSYAPEAQTVVVPRADLLVDDRVVGTVNLDRPTTFDGRLDPGEDVEVTVRGEAPGTAVDTAALCAAGRATLVLLYGPTPTETPDLLRTSASVSCE